MGEKRTVVVFVDDTDGTIILYKGVTGYIKNGDGSVTVYDGGQTVGDIAGGKWTSVHFEDPNTPVESL